MKTKTVYSCQNCGGQFPKWMGKCPECNQWNTLVEESYRDESNQKDAKGHVAFKSALKASITGDPRSLQNVPLRLEEIKGETGTRVTTAFSELDRVLGGGIVPGSLILIGGDPGIGKSTILMQGFFTNDVASQTILYVSGEESAQQIKIRAERLGMRSKTFFIYAENQIENVVEQIQKINPQVLVIDSIQTIYSSQVQSAPGSVSQVRECTAKLMILAKTLGIATFIVGHVTKDGAIAGPKVLEHMVDTVLYFEGSNQYAYRILRAVKNRFGSTNEIGVFEMISEGLRQVTNPSELFLQDRSINAPGTIVVSTIEGTRPVLVEVQALVSSSSLNNPRRTTLGIDHNKVSLLVAVIEKKLGLPLYGHDIFVNVAGGIKLDEPACDLGCALALISSFKNQPIDSKLLVCGEVGLAGEVRRVSHIEQRLTEAERLGFRSVIIPKSSEQSIKASFKKLDIKAVSTLADAVDLI